MVVDYGWTGNRNFGRLQVDAAWTNAASGRGDDGYDTARGIWNAMIDRRPALIVRCAGAADVMASVDFARQHGLLLSVRGGGHNIAGNAVCDDGLMLDMSLMKSVQIAPTAKHAYVEAGATLRDFDHEAQAFGLATPLGINSTTGVAGLTLGGSFGWLSRMYGLSVDNLDLPGVQRGLFCIVGLFANTARFLERSNPPRTAANRAQKLIRARCRIRGLSFDYRMNMTD